MKGRVQLMVYNSKMWEPVSNWERQFCRPAASLFVISEAYSIYLIGWAGI